MEKATGDPLATTSDPETCGPEVKATPSHPAYMGVRGPSRDEARLAGLEAQMQEYISRKMRGVV